MLYATITYEDLAWVQFLEQLDPSNDHITDLLTKNL